MTNVQRLRQQKEAAFQLLEEEQESLWHDLSEHLNRAANGYWSIAAEGCCERIVRIARVVDLTHWGSVQVTLLATGIYDCLATAAELNPDRRTQEEADWISDHFLRYHDAQNRMVNAVFTMREIGKVDWTSV